MATFANETTLRQTADFFKILGDPTGSVKDFAQIGLQTLG